MSNIAIRAENLGKRYRIGGKQEPYLTLRDTLMDAAASPFRKLRGLMQGDAAKASNETIWALKDVSFEVRHGEVVGFIGRNGAGKSTLLKILSRITEPTEGFADVYGRVGALLEVGTGFHPELTGRENVYLNGAILGMTRAEINRKFDEIVDFAGVEKFLDTPVKHYSSGMGLRLGFAVAAHLEPEILVVDEVLAVGDAEFQKKCLGKMSDVAREGRTVLFVSHNMAAVQSLCQRTIWLNEGHIQNHGIAREIISAYLASNTSTSLERAWDDNQILDLEREGVRLHSIRLIPHTDSNSNVITMGTPYDIEISFSNLKEKQNINVTLHLTNEYGITVLGATSAVNSKWGSEMQPIGKYRVVCQIPGDLMNSGTYYIRLLFIRNHTQLLQSLDEVVSYQVVNDGSLNTAYYGQMVGAVRPLFEWVFELLGENIVQ